MTNNKILLPKMIKLLHKGNYRRIEWATNMTTHKDLVDLIQRIIPYFDNELFYRDSDGDVIMFNTDVELSTMLDYFREHLKTDTVKLETRVPKDQKDIYTAKPLHRSITCGSCGGEVRGTRYKCKVCDNYDLCEQCKQSGLHAKHEMRAMDAVDTILATNHWDKANCHADLFIDDSLLVVERREETDEDYMVFVRANMLMPYRHGFFYFEVKITKIGTHEGSLSVGLTSKSANNTNAAGIYSYDSRGEFWGHRVGGCEYFMGNKELPYLEGKPTYGIGHVIGCGVNLATRQIIYTKNGQRLDTANLFVFNTLELYPCIGMGQIGDKVVANFGQCPFEYKELERHNGN